MNGIDRPLDLLNQSKDQKVIITLQSGKEVEAILLAFDIHINLAVKVKDNLRFIRGDSVLFIDKKGGDND